MLSEPPATDLINQAYVSGAFLVEDSIKKSNRKEKNWESFQVGEPERFHVPH